MSRFAVILFLLLPLCAQAAEKTSLTQKMRLLLPNSVALDFASNQSTVYLKERDPLKTEARPISEGAGELSRLFNAISITDIPGKNEPLGFRFKWVPTFTFAFNNLRFTSEAAFVNETDFQIFRTSIGIGPEASYKFNWGAFYLSLAPGASYSWVSWSSPASGGSMARFNSNLAFSYGYFNYFSEDWAMRIFARQVLEDTEVWNEALDSSQGFDVPVESVSNMIVGLSIAYVF